MDLPEGPLARISFFGLINFPAMEGTFELLLLPDSVDCFIAWFGAN